MKTLIRVLSSVVLALLALIATRTVARAADEPLPLEITGAGQDDARAAFRVAIERELGRPVVLVDHAPESGSGLRVTIEGDHATLVYTRSDGPPLDRAVDLPHDEARRIETIALLSGNLLRNEAEELVEELRKKSPHAESTDTAPDATPSATAERPKPPPAKTAAPPRAPKPKSRPKPTPPKPEPHDDLVESPFNATLAHPITVLPDTERRRLNLEIGFAYSRVGAIRGIGGNIFLLRVDHDVRGATFATLWNHAGGDVLGAQMSALVTVGGGNLRGASLAGIANLRGGNVEGAEVSGVFNYAHDVKGVQASTVNIASDFEGGQLGAVNKAADGRIVQAAGVNVARDVNGFQAGVANLARDFDGAQIGLVNVGRKVRGAQVGLVNVSQDMDGVPVGIVNVTKSGHVRAVAWADPRFPVSGGVRFEPNALVTTLASGYDPRRRATAAEAAIGGRLVLGPFFGDVDALYAFEHLDGGAHRHGLRTAASVGARLYSFLGVFAGGGVWQTLESRGVTETSPEYHVGLELF